MIGKAALAGAVDTLFGAVESLWTLAGVTLGIIAGQVEKRVAVAR